jgi:hypothetical protein
VVLLEGAMLRLMWLALVAILAVSKLRSFGSCYQSARTLLSLKVGLTSGLRKGYSTKEAGEVKWGMCEVGDAACPLVV